VTREDKKKLGICLFCSTKVAKGVLCDKHKRKQAKDFYRRTIAKKNKPYEDCWKALSYIPV
jgi:hypothetical protein